MKEAQKWNEAYFKHRPYLEKDPTALVFSVREAATRLLVHTISENYDRNGEIIKKDLACLVVNCLDMSTNMNFDLDSEVKKVLIERMGKNHRSKI